MNAMLARKQRLIRQGSSRMAVIPAGLDVGTGEWVTLAADRLVLLDPRGEMSRRQLLRLLEIIEPLVWGSGPR